MPAEHPDENQSLTDGDVTHLLDALRDETVRYIVRDETRMLTSPKLIIFCPAEVFYFDKYIHDLLKEICGHGAFLVFEKTTKLQQFKHEWLTDKDFPLALYCRDERALRCFELYKNGGYTPFALQTPSHPFETRGKGWLHDRVQLAGPCQIALTTEPYQLGNQLAKLAMKRKDREIADRDIRIVELEAQLAQQRSPLWDGNNGGASPNDSSVSEADDAMELFLDDNNDDAFAEDPAVHGPDRPEFGDRTSEPENQPRTQEPEPIADIAPAPEANNEPPGNGTKRKKPDGAGDDDRGGNGNPKKKKTQPTKAAIAAFDVQFKRAVDNMSRLNETITVDNVAKKMKTSLTKSNRRRLQRKVAKWQEENTAPRNEGAEAEIA